MWITEFYLPHRKLGWFRTDSLTFTDLIILFSGWLVVLEQKFKGPWSCAHVLSLIWPLCFIHFNVLNYALKLRWSMILLLTVTASCTQQTFNLTAPFFSHNKTTRGHWLPIGRNSSTSLQYNFHIMAFKKC